MKHIGSTVVATLHEAFLQ